MRKKKDKKWAKFMAVLISLMMIVVSVNIVMTVEVEAEEDVVSVVEFSDTAQASSPGMAKTMDETQSDEKTIDEDKVTLTDVETMGTTDFAGGSGTESDPYLVDTLAQLQKVAEYSMGGNYFVQTSDIDASETTSWNQLNDRGTWSANTTYSENDYITYNGQPYYAYIDITSDSSFDSDNWAEIPDEETQESFSPEITPGDALGFKPIGRGAIGVFDDYFKGHYDGQGYRITNLYINRRNGNRNRLAPSLFGYVDKDVDNTIENVILEEASITGTTYTGGISGNVRMGTIRNCAVIDSTIRGHQRTGGLVGVMVGDQSVDVSTVIENSFVKNTNVKIYTYEELVGQTQSSGTGLLVGQVAFGSEIKNCFGSGYIENLGEVSTKGELLGRVYISEEITPEYTIKVENTYSVVDAKQHDIRGFGSFLGDVENMLLSGNYFVPTKRSSEHAELINVEEATNYQEGYPNAYSEFDFTDVWTKTNWNTLQGDRGYPMLRWYDGITHTSLSVNVFSGTYDGIEWESHNAEEHQIKIDDGDWIDVGDSNNYIPENLVGNGEEYTVEVKAISGENEVNDVKTLTGKWDFYNPERDGGLVFQDDDGYREAYTETYPLLEKYDVNWTFALQFPLSEQNGTFRETNTAYVNESMAHEMANSGHDIVSHGIHHYWWGGRETGYSLTSGDTKIPTEKLSQPVTEHIDYNINDLGLTGVEYEINDGTNSEDVWITGKVDGGANYSIDGTLVNDYDNPIILMTVDEYDRHLQRLKEYEEDAGFGNLDHFVAPYNSLPEDTIDNGRMDKLYEYYDTVHGHKYGFNDVPMPRRTGRRCRAQSSYDTIVPRDVDEVDYLKRTEQLSFWYGHSGSFNLNQLENYLQLLEGSGIDMTTSEAWNEYRYNLDDIYPAQGLEVDESTVTLETKVAESTNAQAITVEFYDASNDELIGTDIVSSGEVANTEWDLSFSSGEHEWYVVTSASEGRESEVFSFSRSTEGAMGDNARLIISIIPLVVIFVVIKMVFTVFGTISDDLK